MSSYPYRVAIIGAGTSGLAAAVKLCNTETNRPVNITIFEERREAGGRTRSFIDTESGDTLDNGQHLLMGCYTSTLEYLRTINAEHLLWSQNSLELPIIIPAENRRSTLLLPQNIPVPFNLLAGLWRSDLLHGYEKLAALRFGTEMMMFKHNKHMADASCSDLFRHAHQPVSLIKKLWEPLVVGTMNLLPDEASAQVFLNIMRIVFLENRKYSSLLFPKVGLSQLLIDPALFFLEEHDCEIIYGISVTSIKTGNNLIYIESGAGNHVFDAVIFAGSYSDVSFFPKEIQNTIPHITYSPIANGYLWTDKKIIGLPICGFIGTSLQWCFTKPTHSEGELLACTMSAADELIKKDNEEIKEVFWNDIKRSFPYSKANLLRSVIIKEKRATPLLNAELQSKRPKINTDIPGLFLAGDLPQNGLPMTIEGAVRNGQKAAQEVLKRIN